MRSGNPCGLKDKNADPCLVRARIGDGENRNSGEVRSARAAGSVTVPLTSRRGAGVLMGMTRPFALWITRFATVTYLLFGVYWCSGILLLVYAMIFNDGDPGYIGALLLVALTMAVLAVLRPQEALRYWRERWRGENESGIREVLFWCCLILALALFYTVLDAAEAVCVWFGMDFDPALPGGISHEALSSCIRLALQIGYWVGAYALYHKLAKSVLGALGVERAPSVGVQGSDDSTNKDRSADL